MHIFTCGSYHVPPQIFYCLPISIFVEVFEVKTSRFKKSSNQSLCRIGHTCHVASKCGCTRFVVSWLCHCNLDSHLVSFAGIALFWEPHALPCAFMERQCAGRWAGISDNSDDIGVEVGFCKVAGLRGTDLAELVKWVVTCKDRMLGVLVGYLLCTSTGPPLFWTTWH